MRQQVVIAYARRESDPVPITCDGHDQPLAVIFLFHHAFTRTKPLPIDDAVAVEGDFPNWVSAQA